MAAVTRLGLYGGPRAPYAGFSAAAATAALTGTALSGLTEAQIVTGGETIIITLTNDTWVAAGATFNAQRQAIIDGITAAESETTGWNAEVRDKEVVGAVVLTSDTVVTITLTAAAAYDVTANETITVTIPAAALVTSASEVVASPTIGVTAGVSGAGGTPNRIKKRQSLEDIRRASRAALLRKRERERLDAEVRAIQDREIPKGKTLIYDAQAHRIAAIQDGIDRELAVEFEVLRIEQVKKKRKKHIMTALMLIT